MLLHRARRQLAIRKCDGAVARARSDGVLAVRVPVNEDLDHAPVLARVSGDTPVVSLAHVAEVDVLAVSVVHDNAVSTAVDRAVGILPGVFADLVDVAFAAADGVRSDEHVKVGISVVRREDDLHVLQRIGERELVVLGRAGVDIIILRIAIHEDRGEVGREGGQNGVGSVAVAVECEKRESSQHNSKLKERNAMASKQSRQRTRRHRSCTCTQAPTLRCGMPDGRRRGLRLRRYPSAGASTCSQFWLAFARSQYGCRHRDRHC